MNAIVLNYEQRHFTDFTGELQRYAQSGKLLFCTQGNPIPGLPVIKDGAEAIYRNYSTHYQTPWGLAGRGNLSYSSFPVLSGMSVYSLVEPKQDVGLPAMVVPDLAVAVVNPVTGLTSVYAGVNLEGRDLSVETPAWQGKVPLPDRWYGYTVLDEVRLVLALAGAPYYPTKLLVEVVDFPWKSNDGVASSPATIANEEVRLPVVGYAYDPDSKEVIFLSLVGNKTAARSIWGSLSTAHRRRLTLEYPNSHDNRMAVTVESSHNYSTYTQPADDSLLLMHIVDRRCTSGDNTQAEAVYLVLPHGSTDEEKHAAFAARLDAVLPVGVPAQWGKTLYQLGLNNDLVQLCGSGGDVEVAYRLPAAGWLELINTALQEGQLRI